MSGRSRFYFLRQNRFYSSTPLTGYNFISSSKTLVETVIWYTIITLFSVAAAVSMYQMVDYYQTNPTRTYVQTGSRTDNISIGNISLHYTGSLSDFSEVIPTTLSFLEPTNEEAEFYYSVQYLVCNMRLAYYALWKHWMMQHAWTEMVAAMLKPFHVVGERDFSTFDKLTSDLNDFLNDHFEEDLPWSKTKLNELVDEAQSVMNKGLKGNTNAFVLLAMLQAIKEDVDPRVQFFNLQPVTEIYNDLEQNDWNYWRYISILEKIRDVLGDSYDLFRQAVENDGSMYKSRPSEILANVSLTGSQLLQNVYKHLQNVIIIDTDGVASVVLANWTYGGDEIGFETSIEEVYTTYLNGWHKLDLIVLPPSDIQQINIGITLKAQYLMVKHRWGWRIIIWQWCFSQNHRCCFILLLVVIHAWITELELASERGRTQFRTEF